MYYVLKYQSKTVFRNSIKLSIIDRELESNQYDSFYLDDIDRILYCQTKETMFSNKLVALTDRFKKYKMIAGRDIYDIHHFFISGFKYIDDVIFERTGKKLRKILKSETLMFLKDEIRRLTSDKSF